MKKSKELSAADNKDTNPHLRRDHGFMRRVGGVLFVLTNGRRGTPPPTTLGAVSGTHETAREIQRNVPEVGYKEGEPLRLHNQKVVVEAGKGFTDQMSNTRVAEFALPGRDGHPVEFSVLYRQGGGDPVRATSGYPLSWRREGQRRGQAPTPTLTIIPTDQLPTLYEMDERQDMNPNDFVALRARLNMVTSSAGGKVTIGRGTGAFNGLLGPDASREHLTFDLTKYNPYTGEGPELTIADHSMNGTVVTMAPQLSPPTAHPTAN